MSPKRCTPVGAARLPFVMNQFGERVEDDSISMVMRAQADFDVAATEDEVFIEAADLLENFAAHQHTSARDGEKISIPAGAAGDAEGEGWAIGKRMIGETIHAEHNARVLNASVGAKELCANDADGREIRPGDKFAKPLGVGDFHVVIEKQKKLAGGFTSSAVVDGAVVERAWMPEDADARVFRQASEILFGGRFLAAVIDNENF